MRFSRLKSAVVTTLAVGALAGCGSSSHSSGGSSQSSPDNGVAAKAPDAIVQAAAAAARSAHAVHVAGSLVSNGTPITLDMHLVSGTGGRGQLSESGLSFQLISVANSVYINGSPAFWKRFGGSAAAQLLQGKWLKAPSTDASFGSLSALTNFQKFFNGVLGSHGKLTKSATTTVSGQKVVPITDATQGGTLYVATTGPPYPIELGKSGTGGGRIAFTEWNQPVALTAPANAIDISQLKAH